MTDFAPLAIDGLIYDILEQNAAVIDAGRDSILLPRNVIAFGGLCLPVVRFEIVTLFKGGVSI
jgi:hypothetical protein